jgi:hypothetical protein
LRVERRRWGIRIGCRVHVVGFNVGDLMVRAETSPGVVGAREFGFAARAVRSAKV